MARLEALKLDCGTPLLVEHIDGVRSAALTWLVPAGVASEPDDRQGMGAMWGEILMRGAGDRDSRAWADAMDRLGAGRSAEPGIFFFRISATLLGERLADTLPLLIDVVRRPRFDDDAIEPARDLALQSLASLKDDPTERCMLAARERHLPAPINRSGMGNEAGLTALTRDELASTWTRLAVPGRSIFAIAGSVDTPALLNVLNTHLKGWTGTTPEPSIGTNAPRGYAHEVDQTNQVQIVVVHDAPSEVHPDSLLEKVVLSVLSGGMSGRLFTEVREKRALCYSVSAGYRGDRDFGSVTGYVGTTPERAQESLDVLLAEMERINTPAGAITPEEFNRAIVGMKSRLVFSGESTGARAASLAADQFRFGRPRSLEELAREVDGVTLDRVNAYLTRRKLGKLTIQTLGPEPLKATC